MSKKIGLFFIVFIGYSTGGLKILPVSLQDEVFMKVPEIVRKYGYEMEVHQVTTEDSYALTLHRIVSSSSKKRPKPVLVMHGILASSADWIITGPDKALGYQLSKEGYDVWLGNARGNRYSKNHSTPHTSSKKFWDFSFHEIGLYDLPAMVDYILKTTNTKKLFHIGHSQGATTFYVMCSLKPEYNEKIRAHFSLAPVGYVKHLHSPFMRALASTEPIWRDTHKWIGLNEFLPQNGIVSRLAQKACDKAQIIEEFCSNILFAICGHNPHQLNMTILPLIFAHIPAGSSTKQLLHYAQEVNSGHFRQYDYGIFRNLKRYKSWSPPSYDLSKIKAPIYFFYSRNDWISSTVDVWNLAKRLKSVKGKFLVADAEWDHMDYLFGIDANKLVYQKIVRLMTKY